VVHATTYFSKLKLLIHPKKRTKRRKDGSDVDTGMNYDVASFSSWSKSIYAPEMGMKFRESMDLEDLFASF
jgi:hypothetical protein